MASLTERQVEDKIEIVGEYNIIQVRTATIIERDGKEVSRSFYRHIVVPGQDVSSESQNVQGIASLFHTQEVIDAYNARPEP